jgi:hypothetical protein
MRPWALVFVLGALLAFVISVIGGGLAEERAIFGAHESADARRYMISLLQAEPQTLIALSPRTDVVSRAIQFASLTGASGDVTPVSLTYVGGRTSGPYGVHMYAIELRDSSGQRQFFPLALTLVGGKVVRRE